MKIELFIGCLYLAVGFTPCFAKEWKGIRPLQSTRSDVVKILGLPAKAQPAEREYFDLNGDQVEFEWADPTCTKKFPLRGFESAVPDYYLVSNIDVHPKNPLPRDSVTDPNRPFEIYTHDCLIGATYSCILWNDETGFGYTYTEKGIGSLQYYAQEKDFKVWKDRHQTCFDKPVENK